MLTVPGKEWGLQDNQIRRIGTRAQDPVHVFLGLEHMEHSHITWQMGWNPKENLISASVIWGTTAVLKCPQSLSNQCVSSRPLLYYKKCSRTKRFDAAKTKLLLLDRFVVWKQYTTNRFICNLSAFIFFLPRATTQITLLVDCVVCTLL